MQGWCQPSIPTTPLVPHGFLQAAMARRHHHAALCCICVTPSPRNRATRLAGSARFVEGTRSGLTVQGKAPDRMRTQQVMKWIPGLLATTLVAVACDKPPNPAAPKRPSFAALDERTDRITGGGKLGDGRDFATFGFNARGGQGEIEWVQHCLDGVDATDNCLSGSFTFHGSGVSDYGPPLPPAHSPSPRKRVTSVTRAERTLSASRSAPTLERAP